MIDDILNKEGGGSAREKINQSFEKINNTLPNKVDKVLTATQGNVPVFGENGVLLDSGQQPGGGDESNIPEYSEIIPYDEEFVTRYENRLWASKVDGNLGNIPPITTGEDAFWIETAANQTTSTPLWAAGTYTSDRSEVYVLTDKYRKYVLTETAPFTSVDFNAELLNGDWQVIAGDGGGASTDLELVVNNPALSSFSGLATNQEAKDIEVVENLRVIYTLISQLQQAAAYVQADPSDQITTTTEATLTISKLAEPTDPSVIDIDETNNLILIKQPNTYEFITTVVIENTNNQDEIFTLRTRDVAHGDVIITERDISVDRNSTRTLTSIVPAFEVLEGDEPINLRITTESSASTLIVKSLQTILETTGGVVSSGGLANIAQPSNAAIRALTNYAEGVDQLNYINGKLYSFSSISAGVDDDDNYLKPDDIDVADTGRWEKVQEFALKSDIPEAVDNALSETSENAVQNKVITPEILKGTVFTCSYTFAGFDSFPTNFGRKLRIDSITKAVNITELRAGKNGATPTDIDAQLPLTIEASDNMVFEATYNREKASNFTLIGVKL